ncbi:hypothetical protein GCM10009662_51520 [Catellatospora coxensis]|uniref:Collagen triple helix repeat protein n=1 Tax=Catellatospora coxensis TaxID=310354 RepID=A0A8J3P814_9ACTN|nr:hypothetical protein Cco03nite_18710 [Catellatospora coxensis]
MLNVIVAGAGVAALVICGITMSTQAGGGGEGDGEGLAPGSGFATGCPVGRGVPLGGVPGDGEPPGPGDGTGVVDSRTVGVAAGQDGEADGSTVGPVDGVGSSGGTGDVDRGMRFVPRTSASASTTANPDTRVTRRRRRVRRAAS